MKMNAYLEVDDDGRMEYSRKPLIFSHGLWIDGKIYWLGNASEKLLPFDELSIKVKQANIHSKVEFFDIFVTNHAKSCKQAKLILIQRHAETANEHLSFVSPNEDVIFHIADKRIYLVNGMNSSGRMKQCTVQPVWNISTERLWNCRESGKLNYQPMAKGAAASVFSLDLNMGPRETQKSSCWMIEGTEKNTVVNLNNMLLKNTLAFPDKK
ncbi:hypothetical protein M3204_14250 [Mesobacillus subterraneus]|uniref:hypothetical protein n=1 Tax=Mesobacillus subterraneus TaxID=285983 RepID=UPI0020419788|nr:hypothetical protein [Mesobacillus subterraneus]MCM3665574.1 hypothetical protein [Mesobacillus subterraneus]MCM3686245.1 hypothetical protein [Mesobacillus subterraneus]